MYTDAQNRRLGLWLPVGLLLLVLLLFLCTYCDAPRIEADLTNKAVASLAQAGFESDVSFSGRDAKLEGPALSEEAEANMIDIVSNISGVRRVVSNLDVKSMIDSELSIEVRVGKVSLSGLIPEESEAEVVAVASSLYGPDNVTNNLQTSDIDEPLWLKDVLGLLPQLNNELEDASIMSSKGIVRLGGLADTSETRAALGLLAADTFGTGLAVDNKIELREALADPDLLIRLSEGEVELSGAVAEDSLSGVLNFFGNTFGPDMVSADDLIMAEGAAEPAWLAKVLDLVPNLASEVDPLEVKVVEGDLTLMGLVENEERRSAIYEQVRAALEPDLRVVNELSLTAAEASNSPVIPTLEPDTATVTPVAPESNLDLAKPEVRIDILGDEVRLSGVVPSETTIENAENSFTDKQLDNGLQIEANVANPTWLTEIFETSKRVSEDLNRASLEVKEGNLILEGSALSDEQRDAVVAYVTEASPELNVVNRLSVEPLIPFSEDGK